MFVFDPYRLKFRTFKRSNISTIYAKIDEHLSSQSCLDFSSSILVSSNKTSDLRSISLVRTFPPESNLTTE